MRSSTTWSTITTRTPEASRSDMETEKHPPLTLFGKVRWASRELREYIVVLTATFVVVRETGVLDGLIPAQDPDVATPTQAELAPAIRKLDSAGRVVLDPERLDLVPDIEIGEAVTLACPFEGGCAVASTPPKSQTRKPKKPQPRLPATDTAVAMEVEFVDVPPDYGAAIIIIVIVAAILLTMLFKRVRGRWRTR